MQSPPPSLKSSLNHEVVRAGAGAGKTTRLTQKVVAVALDHRAKHGRFPRMILTTFTRKATQEIRERLMQLALKDNDNELFDYVNSTSKLHISTIHGVLSQFLSSYGGKIGLNPSYSVIGASRNQRRIKIQLRESMLVVPEAQDFLEMFTFNQLCDLAEQYYELWATNGLQPVTDFDFAAVASKRAKTLAELCGEVVAELDDTPIEGSWVELKGRLKGLSTALFSEGFAQARLKVLSELDQMGNKPRRSKKNPVSEDTDEKLKNLLSGLKELRERRYDPEAWGEYISITGKISELLNHFCQAFESGKIIDGELVMGDLELLSFCLLREAPEAAESFAAEWDYWFIDEFQDTSPEQVKLLGALSARAPAFVVGDPQQSIYLFRGARSEVFSEREQQVKDIGGLHSQLMKNYRSQPELLEFFNDYFTSYSPQFSPMEPREAPCAPEPPVVAQILLSDGKEESEQEEAEAEDSADPVQISSEVRAIVQRIQELMHDETELSEIAVLGRTNRQLEQVADFAKSLGIPYQLHSAVGFYQRLEIKDALALLKFMLNPHDNANLVRLLRTPWFYVSDNEIAQTTLNTKERSFWLAFEKELAEHPSLVALVKVRSASLSVGLSEAFRQALIERLVFEASDKYDPSGRRESNLWKLLAKIKLEEQEEGFSYLEFVNRVEGPSFLARLDDESDAVPVIEPNKINLMTVHASKGLQFNHVIIGFMGKNPLKRGGGLFASSRESGKWCVSLPDPETLTLKSSLMAEEWRNTLQNREEQEQERLLYVAMTRAKVSITLSWSQPAGKNSWAAHCPFKVTPGTHQKNCYRYLVREENWQPEVIDRALEEQVEVRSVYSKEVESTHRAPVSVTEVTTLFAEQKPYQKASPEEASLDVNQQKEHINAVEQGVRVHTLFELLRYTDESQWEELIASHFPGEVEKASKAVQFLASITEPRIATLLENGYAEWGFVCHVDHMDLQGQIDLWGRDDLGKLCLVDYKTGSSKYLSKAFDQLALYLVGLNGMGLIEPNEAVNLVVIYPFEEKIEVQSHIDSSDLIKLWSDRLNQL